MTITGGFALQAVVRQFIGIALLRDRPQDLPSTQLVLVTAMVLGFLTFTLASLFENNGTTAVLRALLDQVVAALFIAGGLQFQRRTERFVQAFSALVGAGAVLNVMAVPLLAAVGKQPLDLVLSILMLILYAWNLALCAHVFRHTFSLQAIGSAVVAVCYVVTAVQISWLLLPPMVSPAS